MLHAAAAAPRTLVALHRARHAICVALFAMLGCSEPAADAQPGPDPDWAEPHATESRASPLPAPARFDRPMMAAYHMRRHFADLRMVEQFLLAGDLAAARSLAYLLVAPLEDPGMSPFRDQAKRVSEAAAAVTQAPGIDEALRREVRLAGGCAECHIAAHASPMFGATPRPPSDATRAARMARHAWAVDRLWEGLIGLRADLWTRGLTVLADFPAPFPPLSEGPALADRLAALARRQLDPRNSKVLDDRVTAYGEMLVTCAACHEVLRR